MIPLIALLQACGTAEPASLVAAPPAAGARVSETETWEGKGTDASGFYGYAVAAADLNADGYDDVLVGSPGYDSSSSDVDEGAVYVYLGPVTGGASHSSRIESGNNYLGLGTALAAAGDVNGDAYGDFVVGGQGSDGSQRGAAYVEYYWAVTETSLSPTSDDDAWFGGAVSGAGDVDADGFADVIVGAPGYDVGAEDGGAAFVFLGSAAGAATSADWTALGEDASESLGTAVAGPGDVDGDGYSDVLASGSGLGVRAGGVSLFRGGSSGLSAAADWAGGAGAEEDYYGQSAAGLGDVDGDGLADFAVGAPGYDVAGADEGAVYVYLGSTSVASITVAERLEGTTPSAWLGWSLAGGADFDDDGQVDLLVGAPFFAGTYVLEGAASMFRGTGSGFASTAEWTVSGGEEDAFAGFSVATGDIDGDGFSDALVGAFGHDTSTGDGGVARLYAGVADDADGDGYTHESVGGTDCDDDDASVYPGAPESCNGADDSCSGSIPADERDSDGDGYVECEFEGEWAGGGDVAGGGDCDDADASVNPGATETCNGDDDDCDGDIDEDAEDETWWYLDDDGDGYGDGDSDPVRSCDEPTGYVDNAGDCDDGDASVSPAADEVCFDDTDNDCDGEADDESAVDASTWYRDADGDGFGDESDAEVACDSPDGFVAAGGDCDDEDGDVNPDAEEVCNDQDDDCDGEVDDDPADAPTWYDDDDDDGYGNGDGRRFCDDPGEGWAEEEGDCRDRDPSIHPNAEEVDPYDGIDQDCDGAEESVWVSGGGPWGCASGPLGGDRLWLGLVGLTLVARRRRA